MKTHGVLSVLIGTLLVLSAAAGVASAEVNNSTDGSKGSGFGVTPVKIEFNDPALLRGQSYEGQFRLNNQFAETLTVTTATQGTIADWLTLAPANPFTVAPGTTKVLKVTLAVPSDAGNGDYAGSVRIQAKSSGSPSGSGASVNMELVPAVVAKVGGVETLRFSLESARVLDSEAGKSVSFVVDVINTGNVRAAPSFDIQVMDAEGDTVLVEQIAGNEVPASGHASLGLKTVGGLSVGEYEASIALNSDGDTTPHRGLLFKVVPAGTLALSEGKQGSLASLTADKTVKPNGVAKIAATFANTGAKDILNAKLNAEISLDGERVAVLASEPVVIPAGTESELEMFWTAGQAGVYSVKAWATFDGLKSASKDATITVSEAASGATDGSGANVGSGTGATGGSGSTGAGSSGTGSSGGQSEESGESGKPIPGPALIEVLAIAALAGYGHARRTKK